MNEIGVTLVWCAIQVTVVGLGALALHALAWRYRPAAGTLTILTSLVIIVVLSALAFSPWPCWPFLAAWQQRVTSVHASTTRTAQPVREKLDVSSGPGDRRATQRYTGGDSRSADSPRFDAPDSAPVESDSSVGDDATSSSSQAIAQGENSDHDARAWSWGRTLAITYLVCATAGIGWFLVGLTTVWMCHRRSCLISDASLNEMARRALRGVELLSCVGTPRDDRFDCGRDHGVASIVGVVAGLLAGVERPATASGAGSRNRSYPPQ